MGAPPSRHVIDHCATAFATKQPLRSPADKTVPSSALELGQRTEEDFSTHVLSTLFVDKWITPWAVSLMALISQSITECSHIVLLALKGGRACDEELMLLPYLMEKLGFGRPSEEQANFSVVRRWSGSELIGRLHQKWHMDRGPDAFGLLVELRVHRDPESMYIVDSLAPYKCCEKVPNLRRIAMISAPRSNNAIAGINQQLEFQSQIAKERAERKGYHPSDPEEILLSDDKFRNHLWYMDIKKGHKGGQIFTSSAVGMRAMDKQTGKKGRIVEHDADRHSKPYLLRSFTGEDMWVGDENIESLGKQVGNLPPGWTRYVSDTGKPFYRNGTKSQWFWPELP